MTDRLRKAFINNLDDEDWMDSVTKSAAKEKVKIRYISEQIRQTVKPAQGEDDFPLRQFQ